MKNKNEWDEFEMQELRRLYPNNLNEQISILIGRSENAICKKARKMGLEKSEHFHKSGRSGRILPRPKSAFKRFLITIFRPFLNRKFAA